MGGHPKHGRHQDMESEITLRPEWLDDTKAFAFPDWVRIHEWAGGTFAEADLPRVYNKLARSWVDQIGARFPCAVDVAESENFIAVTARTAGNIKATLVQLEDYRLQIQRALAGLDLIEWSSKVVVVIAPDQETFTRYLGDYYEDGEHMLPGGVCLKRGYVHFVLPDNNLTNSAPVLAHELTHVCVSGIPWPVWVEESVVQSVEHRLSQRNPYVLDRDIVQRHQRYWDPAKVRDFWSGRSFNYPNEGSELSYHLCRFLLEAVAHHGREALMVFLRNANQEDSGFGAMRAVVGFDPAEVLEDLLGVGDWKLRDERDKS
jgi:hypothetical protein